MTPLVNRAAISGKALMACLSVYFLALLIGTLLACRRAGWSYALVLPLVFTTLHISYGTGFLIGLVRWWNRWYDKLGRTPRLDDRGSTIPGAVGDRQP